MCAVHPKAVHEPGTASLNIPVARDLHGIGFLRHRLNDGWPSWPQREGLYRTFVYQNPARLAGQVSAILWQLLIIGVDVASTTAFHSCETLLPAKVELQRRLLVA